MSRALPYSTMQADGENASGSGCSSDPAQEAEIGQDKRGVGTNMVGEDVTHWAKTLSRQLLRSDNV